MIDVAQGKAIGSVNTLKDGGYNPNCIVLLPPDKIWHANSLKRAILAVPARSIVAPICEPRGIFQRKQYLSPLKVA